MEGILQQRGARLVLQLFLPGIIFIVSSIEVRLRFTLFFLKDQHLDLFVLAGKVRHSAERFLFVLVPEQMGADDVERTAQLQICRVLGMVAVHELAALLDFHAWLAVRLLIAVAGAVRRKLVNIGQELINGEADGEVGVVEHTDNAFFLQRVRLLLVADALCLALP